MDTINITRKYIFGNTILQRPFFHRSHITLFTHMFLFHFTKKLFITIHKNNNGHRIWMTSFKSQHQYFSIFSIKISVCPFIFIVILKMKSITTTIVSFNRGYMFHISLQLKLATVVKLFPTKLKHNRYFISFITHKDALANETTMIAKSSPFSFISKNKIVTLFELRYVTILSL